MSIHLRNIVKVVLLGMIITFSAGCFERILRGYAKRSYDHKTYLVIMEKEIPGCEILVDGHNWSFGIGEKGIIEPGIHKIKCISELEIDIKKGTTFYFNYWGP